MSQSERGPALSALVGEVGGHSLKLKASNAKRVGHQPGALALEVDSFIEAAISIGPRGRTQVFIIAAAPTPQITTAGPLYVQGSYAVVRAFRNPAEASFAWQTYQPIGTLEELSEQLEECEFRVEEARGANDRAALDAAERRRAALHERRRRALENVGAPTTLESEEAPTGAKPSDSTPDHVAEFNVVPSPAHGDSGGLSTIDLRRVAGVRTSSTIGGRAELLVGERWMVVHCTDSRALLAQWRKAVASGTR